MPTPSKGYRLKDGTRVPGTTTITGRFKESGGLIHWANRLALEPLLKARHMAAEGSLPELVAFLTSADPDAWDNKKAAQKAADAGSCAHDMFDHWIRGMVWPEDKYPRHVWELAYPAWQAAVEWAKQSKFEIVETEVQLVSEKHRFGGTRDACLVNAKRCLADWKTSRDIYPEMLCQLAAYAILDEEAGNVIDGGFHLLKFSKQEKPEDPVRFQHHYWSHLDQAREAFLLMRRLYDLMADLGKIAK